MNSDSKLLLDAYQGKKKANIPFWFMRQAGRYLPEYREVRSKHKNFLEFCYTPEAACKVTLQPIERFGMSGAIIFSDILVIPDALGVDVRFEEGRGPILVPIRTLDQFKTLSMGGIDKKLSPVYEALKLTRKALPSETTLIGFCGAPWTLACYMVEGGSSKDFSAVKTLAKNEPDFFSQMIALLAEAVTHHAISQIEAGADAIQLFDSWAGILDDESYRKWVIEPTAKIVSAIKKHHPNVPIIGFPRQSGSKFLAFAEITKVDVLSIDHSVPLAWAKQYLAPKVILQGCLDNTLLADDKEAMLSEAASIIETFSDKAFVFNLAHGILPHTPVDHVQALCQFIKNNV